MGSVENLPGRETQETRSFRLPLTSKKVGIGPKGKNTYPVFPYHIKVGEIHNMGNLQVTSSHPCVETKTVELIFRETHCQDHSICINDLRLDGDILRIGTKGEAVFRRIGGELGNIIMLEMSLLRSIELSRVNTQNHQSSSE